MKTFKIDELEKDCNIVTEWNELTIQQYVDLYKLSDDARSGKFNLGIEDENINNNIISMSILLQLISILSNENIQNINQIEVDKLDEIGILPAQLFSDLTDKKKDFKVNDIILIKDEFGMLREWKLKDPNKLLSGELISYEHKKSQYKNGREKCIYLLSIVCRPIIDGKIEIFDADNIEERAEFFRIQKASDFIGYINFFLIGNE